MRWGQIRHPGLVPRLLRAFLLVAFSWWLLLSSAIPVCLADGPLSERAILEIVLYNPVENGGYVTQSYKLVGMFSEAGTSVSAEGRIIQVSGRHEESVRNVYTHIHIHFREKKKEVYKHHGRAQKWCEHLYN